MPYIEKIGKSGILDQLHQWEGVMHDPYIDGFNGWGCKQKLYKIKFELDAMLEKAPTYTGEDEWLAEQRTKKAFERLKYGV